MDKQRQAANQNLRMGCAAVQNAAAECTKTLRQLRLALRARSVRNSPGDTLAAPELESDDCPAESQAEVLGLRATLGARQAHDATTRLHSVIAMLEVMIDRWEPQSEGLLSLFGGIKDTDCSILHAIQRDVQYAISSLEAEVTHVDP